MSLGYVDRINLTLDYIVNNLDGDLRLEAVAKVADFSPFHFHRIFRSFLGETLNEFVKRSRLERSLYLMSYSPRLNLTQVAIECGFSSSADFSRSFKARFGQTPSAFDLAGYRTQRREDFEATMASYENRPKLARLPPGDNPDGFSVEIRKIPSRSVAYMRALNPYQSTVVVDTCNRMMAWAEQRGVAHGQWLGYMWEDPEITALEDCRYDIALEIEASLAQSLPDGEVCCHHFPKMHVAEVAVTGDIELEQRALDWLFGTWLPESGFNPAEQPAFEAWNGRPFAHGYEHFDLRCQLPVLRS